MKFLDMVKTSASNLWRNKGRTFLTIIAVCIGSFTIALTSAVNIGVNDYIQKQLSVFGDDSIIYFKPKQDNGVAFGPQEYKEGDSKKADSRYTQQTLNSKDLEKINKISNVKNARFYKMATPDYIQYKDSKKLTITSVIVEVEGQKFDFDFLAGGKPKNRDEVTISQDYLEPLGFKNAQAAIGEKVTFRVSDSLTGETKAFTQKISGVTTKSLIQSAMVTINEPTSNEIYDFQTKSLPKESKEKSISALAQIEGKVTEDKLNQIKENAKKAGYSAFTAKDQVETIMNVINGITGSLIVFGAIALLAASFGIINTLYMSVRERTREIGLMKAMGLSNRKIFQLFSIEAIMIGLIGSILGILLASLAGDALNSFASKDFLKGLEGFNLTKFTIENSITITLIIAVVAFLAGALPARSASKKDPIEALRYE